MSPTWSRWMSRWRSVLNGKGRASRRRERNTFVRLRFEWLETRETPAGFTGGVSLAAADVNGDGFLDILTGAGPGGGPHVKVISGQTGQALNSFYAYDPAFTGGVFVAAGDIDDDGKDDIITGAGLGGGPAVKVFSGATGAEIRSFDAYDAGFSGGVRVASADVDGDGRDDIITGAGPGGGPNVRVFSGATGARLQDFNAFDAGFTGGVYVAAGDIDGDGKAEVVTGAGPGGGPDVRIFSGATGAQQRRFNAYDDGFTGGVRVAVGDVDGDGKNDVLTGAGPGGGPHVKAFNGATGAAINGNGFMTFDGSFSGGVFIAAGDLDGDNKVEFITGAGEGGDPVVMAFHSTTLAGMVGLFAYDPVAMPGGPFAVSGVDTSDKTPPTVQITSTTPATVTSNVTITGKASDVGSGVVTLRAQVDTQAPTLVSLDPNGNFSFTTTFALDGTNNGAHTVKFTAVDRGKNESQPANVTFSLNATTPGDLAFDLADASDTGVKGDQRTELGTVNLTGTITPNSGVSLLKGSAVINTNRSDANGVFRFDNVVLDQEVNDLTVQSADTAGSEQTLTRTFFRNTAPTVAGAIADFQVAAGAQDTILNFPAIFSDANVNSQVHFNTSSGGFDLQLFDQQTPLTVANFLKYITDGDYANSIFHRSVADFVVQGGGFAFQASPADINAITTNPAVQNEPVLSNQLGTIAMAKLGSDPNSATSQFFFNLKDNSRTGAALDSQNGGFTAFGQLLGNGQDIVNQLAAIPTQDRSNFAKFPGVFTDIPLQNYPAPPAGNFPTDTTAANYALVTGVTVSSRPDPRSGDALVFSIVSNTNEGLLSATLANDARLVLNYTDGQSGVATITVRATDKNGAQATTSFTVTVGDDTTDPTVTITSPPSGQTFAASPEIVGTATDNLDVTQLQATVDGGAAQNVTVSGTDTFTFTPTVTTEGQHTVSFTATDAAGNTSTPVTFTYTLDTSDTTAPTVTIAAPPSGQTFAANPAITGTATDNVGVTLLQATVDGGTAQDVTVDGSGNFTFTPAATTDGQHTVSFTAKDALNNTSTPVVFTYTLDTSDTTDPTVTITSPASGGSFTASPAIVGTATDDVGVTQLQVSVDGGTAEDVTVDGSGNFTFTPAATTEGEHTVSFTAKDAADNTSTPVVFTYTIDTTNPTVTGAIQGSPPASSNPTIAGQATDNIAVTQLQASVDGGAAVDVTFDESGNFTFTPSVPTDGSANGAHTVTFTAHDAAGNVNEPVLIIGYALNAPDTTAPTVTITSPANNQTFTTNPAIVGVASDNVAVTQLQASVDGGAAQNVTVDSSGNFTFTPAAATNGQHTVTFIARDAAGNSSTPVTLTYILQLP